MGLRVALAAIAVVAALIDGGVAAAQEAPRVVFLVNEDPDNYEAHRTIPRFADQLRRDHDWQVTVLQGEGSNEAYRFTDPATLDNADLLVIFCRRLALPPKQMAAIKLHLRDGKPLVGIRTANHAFSVRGEVAQGHEDWWQFVPEVLGCENRGYGPTQPGTIVSVAEAAKDHPILRGLAPQPWRSEGNVYHTAPLLDPEATVLLHGEVPGQGQVTGQGEVPGKVEPIAWTRTAGSSRIFYTSLGHPSDFERPWFSSFLSGAIRWALARGDR